jgi:hypothetical protein
MASTRCYHPVKGYRAFGGGVTFDAHKSTGVPTSVPCGRCLGCRLENSRQWAIRMMHEAQTHRENCFLTLTYDADHLPTDSSLERDRFPAFIKNLRNRLRGKRNKYGEPYKVRYFHCGEYGASGDRPHYHAVLFGYSFLGDRKQWTIRDGNPVWRSEELEELWPDGFSEIGSVTFKSAAYVARYVTKKIKLSQYSSEEAIRDYHERYLEVTLDGEYREKEQEFATMSLRPGIGEGWFRKYWSDVYPKDQIVMNGKTMRPPRYYDRLLHRYSGDFHRKHCDDPDCLHHDIPAGLFEKVRRMRLSNADRKDQTPERLRVQEVCKEAEVTLFQQRD